MRQKSKHRAKKIILVQLVIITALSLKTFAQLNPIPQMWVKDSLADVRKQWFKTGVFIPGAKTKEKIFDDAIGATHPLYYDYPVSSFTDLFSAIYTDYPNGVNGIRVYLAAFNPKNIPPGCNMTGVVENQALFIFAPSKGKDLADYGTYYFISLNDHKVCRITKALMDMWVAKYTQMEMTTAGGLINGLEPNQSENRIGTTNTYADTYSIYYPYENLNEFINTERIYQDNNTYNNPGKLVITGIRVSFASITDKGIGKNIDNSSITGYKNRLIIYFDFLRRIGSQDVVFSIDTTNDFNQRPPPNYSQDEVPFIKDLLGSGDNGHLCPPNCP